jgi:structural maintenance of chromosome 1
MFHSSTHIQVKKERKKERPSSSFFFLFLFLITRFRSPHEGKEIDFTRWNSLVSKRMSAKVLRLELYNFKSYIGRAVIGPFFDFSCIVGPNGAGKSNLMDALSFVLGANATVLRSTNVQDFINRKAKKQECSVTLVLRQSSGSELALMRAVDAKGAVKVFVDGHPVSEKEFGVVLKKAKIGSRINTFLVFQHEVDAVAQKKAKDLTELIEEVSTSGELKEEYAQKKKALDHANEVLTAASIEKRGAIAEVNQMRLHKKEAEKFNEVNEKLNQERRELALSELFFIEGLLNRQKKELDVFQAEVAKLQTTISSEDDLKAMKKLYADKHKEYLEFLKKNRTVSHDLRDKKGTLDRIKASLEHLQKKHDMQASELKAAQSSNQIRSTEAARLETQLKQQESLLAAFEESCKREDRENPQGSLTAEQMKEYRRLKGEADCETITARQELETSRRSRDSLNEGLKQAAIAIENQESHKKELLQTIERNEDRIREASTKRADMIQQNIALEGKIAQGKSSLQLMHSKKEEREAELAAIQSQLHELRFVKEDNKAAAKMSDALQSLRGIHSGIRGRLIDLCEIPNPRYRNAVTVSFGKNLEAVVVDTMETAVSCVRYLKEQGSVSMTFIPLSSAQGKAVDDSLRGFRGTCKPVIDVIKFDPVLEAAVRYAVGQTLVCDTMDEAKAIAFGQPNGQRHRVVTIEGTVLNKNGSIQGGLASIQSRARKWDERRYDDLKAARDKIVQEMGGSGSNAEDAKALCELQDMQSRLEFNKNRIKALDAEISSTKAKVLSVQNEIKTHEEVLAQLLSRKEKYAQGMQKSESDMIKAQKAVSIVEARIFSDFQKKVNIANVADLERREAKTAKDRAEKRQQLLLVIHKLKASIETETKRVGVKSPKELEEIARKTAAEIVTCKKDLQTYQAVADTFEKKHEEAQRLVTKAKAELDALEDKIRSNSKSSESEIRKLVQARKNVTMLQAACDALRAQRLSLFQRCRMEQTDLPVVSSGSVGSKRQLDAGPASSSRKNRNAPKDAEEEYLNISEAFTSYSESEGTRKGTAAEVSVCVDFSGLTDTLRRIAQDKGSFVAYKQRAEATVDQLERELESIAPNLKASMRFMNSENKLGATATSLEEARERSRKCLQEFTVVKELRAQRFMETFEKVVEHVDRIYRELTLGTRAHDVHGSAYLTLEDAEEPYNGGTKYHATPPMKRFMTMELLSGGERTMAALALLFAIHAISPTPFFVLDEVDAALDIGNVEKLAKYLRSNSANCQYIVVSLKEQLYHEADTLIGVYKDREQEGSSTATVDLRRYPVK